MFVINVIKKLSNMGTIYCFVSIKIKLKNWNSFEIDREDYAFKLNLISKLYEDKYKLYLGENYLRYILLLVNQVNPQK